MSKVTNCSRCANREGGRVPNPVRIREYKIDGRRKALLCDACVELTATHHDVDQVGAPKPTARSRTRRKAAKAKA